MEVAGRKRRKLRKYMGDKDIEVYHPLSDSISTHRAARGLSPALNQTKLTICHCHASRQCRHAPRHTSECHSVLFHHFSRYPSHSLLFFRAMSDLSSCLHFRRDIGRGLPRRPTRNAGYPSGKARGEYRVVMESYVTKRTELGGKSQVMCSNINYI